jgi:hypothetical protein
MAREISNVGPSDPSMSLVDVWVEVSRILGLENASASLEEFFTKGLYFDAKFICAAALEESLAADGKNWTKYSLE